MRYFKKLSLLLLLALILGPLDTARAQSISSCERALGEAYLDINNVRARILNTGGLFYRGEPHVYEVPKGTGKNTIFASGIWLAGQVGGQLRASASRYGEWELWAGPLDENGNPPADCSVYDRVYKVSRSDIEQYEVTGAAAPDLRDWPTGLGAPTLAPPGNEIDDDEDGEVDEEGETIKFDVTVPLAQRRDRVIDLAAGERPALLGDQSIWAVMNDRGNQHQSTDAPPIGIEVHMLAFGFNTAGPIGNSTFYKFNVIYKGNVPLENAYFGIFSDPDMGNFDDDYVGSDTTLGLGYVYNADNNDEGSEGYGDLPPAAGYDFFQGPIVPSPNDTAHVSGRPVPGFRNLKMSHFVFYNNGGCASCDPVTGEDYYNYMRGFWKDGQPITFGGNGRGFSQTPVDYIFPGDPVTGEGWTEFNPAGDGSLPPLDPADRRFVLSTGPFTINPGDQQEIVFGIVWSQGVDNIDSVRQLRADDALAQAAFDVNFELPQPPAAPEVTVTELDGQVILEWGYSPRANNYLESYVAEDPFAPDEDDDYVFEGYRIIRYADDSDQVGQVVAIYDVANGITRVIDGIPGEPSEVTAAGTDSGVQRFYIADGLTNYTTYHFGVQAYAYNELSFPKVYNGPITRVQVTPTQSPLVLSEEAGDLNDATAEPDIVAERGDANVGDGAVTVDVVNPGRLVGGTYEVRFYERCVDAEVAGKNNAVASAEDDVLPEGTTRSGEVLGTAKSAGPEQVCFTTYDIFRDGTKLFDGSEQLEGPAPQRRNVVHLEGLQFSVTGPEPGFKNFLVVENAAGPLDPPEIGTFAFNSNGFPFWMGTDRPSGDQQATTDGRWGINVGGGNGTFASYFSRSITGRSGNLDRLGAYDYEWRFTEECAATIDGEATADDCLAWRAFEDGALVEVPFEIWRTGINTPDDPSDDIRMAPGICEAACGGGTEPFIFDIGGDHPVSGGADDPFSDWIYWFMPSDMTPGESGYECFFFSDCGASEVIARQVLVNWNAGAERPYSAELPETGTVFRYVTDKPNQPGDVYTFSTEGLGAEAPSLAVQEARLEEIGIVPNPYKGASNYEKSQLIDEVRFTNLPDVATIRVFTLNGTLVKTLNKQSPGVRWLKWDLTTDNLLPLASGMYLVHVEVPGVGERVIKFGVIKKRVQLNAF